MLGALTDNQIDHVLLNQLIGRIGCSSKSKTYVVPITYAYHKGYIYAHSREGLKIEMMRKNPEVCFEVDTMDNIANWRSVILWGKYEELETKSKQQEGMKILIDRFAHIMTSETLNPFHGFMHHPPEAIEKGLKAVVYRIKVARKTGRYEKSSGEQYLYAR